MRKVYTDKQRNDAIAKLREIRLRIESSKGAMNYKVFNDTLDALSVAVDCITIDLERNPQKDERPNETK